MVLKLLAICITVFIIAVLQINVRGDNEVPLNSDQLKIIHSTDQTEHYASQEASNTDSILEEILPSSENKLDTGQTLQDNLASSKTDDIPTEVTSDFLTDTSVSSQSAVELTESVIYGSFSRSLESSESDVTVESSQEQITTTETLQTVNLQASLNISSETSTNEVTPVLDKDNSIITTDKIEQVTLDSNIVTDPGEAPSPTPISAPPERSIDTTTGPDDLESAKQEEDFPSFAEWTQKVLAEQEKTKQESKTTTGKASQPSTNQKKLRNNYASKACGAKVLAANPEAENINHVLTANKDEYMINPCSSKKWFVVELCEPVQVKLLELASLELFSSQPKSFRVSISDRYPAKEWIPLGLYEAFDERSVQSFQALNDRFVKYVKVELIEHYGNEHFCPVTLFRLYGVPITDDDDNEENENNSNSEAELDDDVTDEEENKEGAKNLFMSAKDTVVNLVKKVLNVNKDTDKIDTNITDAGTEQALNISADGTILPCVPSITQDDLNLIDIPSVLFPTPTIKDSSGESSADTTDPPIVTKLDDDEQLEAEKLLTSSPDVKACLNNSFTSPKILCSYIQTMLKFPLRSICQKGELVIVSTSIQRSKTLKSSSEESITSSEEQSEVTQSEIVPTQSDSGIESTVTKNYEESRSVTLEDFSTESSESLKDDSTREVEVDLTEQTDQKSTENVEESQTSQNIDTTSQIILEPSTSDISINKDQSEVSTEKLDVTETTSQILGEQTQMESEMIDLPLPESSQVQPDVILPTVSEVSTETQSSSEIVSTPEKATPGIELPIADEILPKDKSGGKPKDLELVKVPLGSIAKRETAIMRLTNRIKALELNVSLSSRFLEELSKKFKKQNEDMMKLMNKTIARLNATTRESEIRDLHQQRRLDILEARLDNLTSLIDTLSHNMEALANKISDRQIVWSSIEFVMLMVVCAVCLIRGRSVNISPELKHLLETMPKQPNPNTNLRRNSISSIGYVSPTTKIRKNISMTSLVDQAICDNKPPSVTPDQDTQLVQSKDGLKKKKKRKKSIGSKSSTYIHEKVDNDTSPVQISCEAGLLFGTDAGTSLSGVGIQEVDPGPHSQSSSSSTVSLPAQCHRRNFSDDITDIHTTNNRRPITLPKPLTSRGQKNKKQNRNFIANEIKVETLKPLHGKGTKPKDEHLPSVTTTSILTEPRNKSRVSWLF